MPQRKQMTRESVQPVLGSAARFRFCFWFQFGFNCSSSRNLNSFKVKVSPPSPLLHPFPLLVSHPTTIAFQLPEPRCLCLCLCFCLCLLSAVADGASTRGQPRAASGHNLRRLQLHLPAAPLAGCLLWSCCRRRMNELPQQATPQPAYLNGSWRYSHINSQRFEWMWVRTKSVQYPLFEWVVNPAKLACLANSPNSRQVTVKLTTRYL